MPQSSCSTHFGGSNYPAPFVNSATNSASAKEAFRSIEAIASGLRPSVSLADLESKASRNTLFLKKPVGGDTLSPGSPFSPIAHTKTAPSSATKCSYAAMALNPRISTIDDPARPSDTRVKTKDAKFRALISVASTMLGEQLSEMIPDRQQPRRTLLTKEAQLFLNQAVDALEPMDGQLDNAPLMRSNTTALPEQYRSLINQAVVKVLGP